MINLVVVALLLASCLADNVVIKNFQFLCQKHNGEFVPMGSTPTDKTEMLVNADSFGLFTWAHNMGTYDLQPHANPPGLITITDSPEFKHGRQIWVVLVLSCSLPYRKLCPAVNNICVSSGKSNPETAPIDYNKYANYFNGGVYLLRTPQDARVAMSKDKLPKEKLNGKEFCEVPEGKNSITCSWTDTEQYSHTSYDAQSSVSSESAAAAAQSKTAPVVEGQEGGNGTGKGVTPQPSNGAAATGAFMALPLLALF